MLTQQHGKPSAAHTRREKLDSISVKHKRHVPGQYLVAAPIVCLNLGWAMFCVNQFPTNDEERAVLRVFFWEQNSVTCWKFVFVESLFFCFEELILLEDPEMERNFTGTRERLMKEKQFVLGDGRTLNNLYWSYEILLKCSACATN